MPNSSFVISLDFELFWGVLDCQTLADYGPRVAGEWVAIPKMLSLFRCFEIKATWATVGMAMCKDFREWNNVRPSVLPGYNNTSCNPYFAHEVVQANPELFFARSLVEKILETPGQELGSHSYSHFYCGEPGATSAQFEADLDCALYMSKQLEHCPLSFVFPRNMVIREFLESLSKRGFKVWRSNPEHFLYRHGHIVPAGLLGRALRLADTWFPLSGANMAVPFETSMGVNLPASAFLRPWQQKFHCLEQLRFSRIANAMTDAAKAGRVYHLWWHPHNFGLNQDCNLAFLERILTHYKSLKDEYGMESRSMGDFAVSTRFEGDNECQGV